MDAVVGGGAAAFVDEALPPPNSSPKMPQPDPDEDSAGAWDGAGGAPASDAFVAARQPWPRA